MFDKKQEDISNITIDFILKNGENIHFVNEVNYNYAPYKPEAKTNSEHQESYKETIIMDGKKTEVHVAKKETVRDDTIVEGIDFIWEIDEEWFLGSSGSGYSTDNSYMLEKNFTFQKSFDWDNVEMMIINGTEVEFN